MSKPKSNDIDLDNVNKAQDKSIVNFVMNGVKLQAPKCYIGDNTAIAGKINKGRIAFHRCKPENTGKYNVHETEHGTLSFGENFRSALKALVK